MKKYTTILSIAGSDSIGGAGIQADIKTACALGVYAMTAITAVTAQNTMGVQGILPVGADMLRRQIRAVCEDVRPDAVKIGMVPDAESAKVIIEAILEHDLKNVVLDPVMVSTSGSVLSEGRAIDYMIRETFGYADLITPNIPEAEAILKSQGSCAAGTTAPKVREMPEDMMMWPVKLAELCRCRSVLLKGGHGDGRELTDYLWHDGVMYAFKHDFLYTINTHGTGCSLSTAIACQLALGEKMDEAVGQAIGWLLQAIDAGADYELGHGNGPINHMGV